VHRGSPLAYGSDALALTIARQTVAEGRDEAFGPDERAFLYMPFEHSESRIDQHTSVGLFTVLRDAAPEDLGEITNAYLGHARHHRDIVQRFGRFPHRNAILGRRSTPEELKFLETAGDFGQTPASAEPTSGPASGPGS
jgi:uncharacterized protein (DUF924 family)